MLEDYRKVMIERRGEEEQFTSEHIAQCMKKVIPLDLKQTVQVDKDLQIRAYYAGHVSVASGRYVLEQVDKELSKGDQRAAISLVKDLQFKPGGLRCFGIIRHIQNAAFYMSNE